MSPRWLSQMGVALLLLAFTQTAQAQSLDPGAVVQAYIAALSTHDVTAALALFDEYGSATDVHGRVYQGQAGLTEFLLANGFAGTTASVSTVHLTTAGNRAIWTYSCTCTSSLVNVRVVLQHDRISVFAITPPPPGSSSHVNNAADVTWLGPLVILGLLAAFAFGVSRGGSTPGLPRPAQGRLLVGLEKAYALKRRN